MGVRNSAEFGVPVADFGRICPKSDTSLRIQTYPYKKKWGDITPKTITVT